MPNKHYLRGVRFERDLVNLGRAHGWEAWRSAGSHSMVDVTWCRENDKVRGSIIEGLELIRTNGFSAEPDMRKVPDFFQHGFWRYTKGLNKKWVWVRAVDDGTTQVILFQCKTKVGKK